MNTFLHRVLMMVMVGLLVGCSSTHFDRVEHWRKKDASYTPNYALLEKQKKAVDVFFFRKTGGQEGAVVPVNLYINGEYQASLVDKAYTKVRLCPGQHTVSAYAGDVRNKYAAKKGGVAYTVVGGTSSYFEVLPVTQGAATVSVSNQSAMGEIGHRQSHTISRVVNPKCG